MRKEMKIVGDSSTQYTQKEARRMIEVHMELRIRQASSAKQA